MDNSTRNQEEEEEMKCNYCDEELEYLDIKSSYVCRNVYCKLYFRKQYDYNGKKV